MKYLNDWIWLRLSTKYNVTHATDSLTDVYGRWVNEVTGDLGVDLVQYYLDRVPYAESLNDAEYAYWAGGPFNDAVFWVDAEVNNSSLVKVKNLGSGGSVLDAQYGDGVTSSKYPTWLPHVGVNYMYLPGVAGNYASTPEAAALDITGDIDIRVQVAMDDWTPAADNVLSSKRTSGSSTTQSYELSLRNNGGLRLIWADGTTNNVKDSTVALTVSDGSPLWVRATLDVDNGSSQNVVTFYTSNDGSTWTQLGAAVTTAGTTSITTDTNALFVGSRGTSGLPLAGKVYRAQIRDGINGTTVFDADFTKLAHGGQTTFTEDSSNAATVTINRATSGRKTVVVDRPVWLFGTDDYLEVPDNDLLDMGATDSFTVVWVGRQWATPPGFQRLVDKSNTADTGWSLENATGANVWASIDDGPNAAFRNGNTTFTLGMPLSIGMTVDRGLQQLRSFTGQTRSAAVSTTAVGSVANSLPMRIGSNARGAGGQFGDFELVAVAVWRRALTVTELGRVALYYNLTAGPWGGLVLGENGIPILTENNDVINVE